ncbi:hypothetical protein AB0K51_02310 [Kitasatospora sp. NPDC049285]|uniref:hypothetical protein n=1 Tax=Kitasatospora sp. NPDC049285 TaxID=3157096 RepID=UPI003440E0B0
MRLRATGAVLALLLGAGLTGCGSGSGATGADRPVVELARARTELQTVLDGTSTALSPALRYADDAYRATPHEDGLSRENDGTAQLTLRRYVLTKVAAAKQPRLLEQARAYWTAQGYTVTADGSRYEAGARTPGGTGITLTIGAPGNVTLVATARVKDPGSTEPFGAAPSPLPTGADGAPDTMPRYEDPQWSS